MKHKSRQPLKKHARHSLDQLVPKQSPELMAVVERNMEAIETHRRESDNARTFEERLADGITYFTGSMPFIYFHVVLFVVWILVNVGIAGIPAFDPYPFGLLTTIVSLEAIFLSTFVLVSQNREALIAERRTELDLHINLLSEYEVTRILILADAIAKQLHVKSACGDDLAELEKDIQPEVLLRELEQRTNNKNNKSAKAEGSEGDVQ